MFLPRQWLKSPTASPAPAPLPGAIYLSIIIVILRLTYTDGCEQDRCATMAVPQAGLTIHTRHLVGAKTLMPAHQPCEFAACLIIAACLLIAVINSTMHSLQKHWHNWTTCFYLHPSERARRRNPLTHSYAAVMCPDMQKQVRHSKAPASSFSRQCLLYSCR